jgi:DNA polymerase-3 subunit alpha
LIDIIPIMKREQDGQIVTQFDYPTCEGLGLIKMDFLGLRNLTIISDALENIRLNRGEELDLERLELDDTASYELLARGDTLGVFQLDGGPMRGLLRLMKPDNFEDISAVLALYRPGPMGADSHTNYALRKNGLQPITPIHPQLEEPLREILDTTYGLIIYQEQVMSIAQKVAGFSLGQADILRRAMGKKKKEELDKQYEGFSGGMKINGFGEAAIKALWDILLPFSDYAFNKAHSAAYGVISYWTAFLKAHYPAEYMAALLTSVGDSKDKLAIYLNECRRMGIKVLPPAVNESFANFAAVGDDIRFGLGAIRNVGANVVEGIRGAREAQGRFESFHDFLKKVPLVALNKRTVESLVKAGAFDGLGGTRRALVEIHETAIESAVKSKRDAEKGNVGFDFDSLFAEAAEDGEVEIEQAQQVPDRPEWTKKDKLAFEREMLGLYVSDHPLRGLEAALAKEASETIQQVTDPDASPGYDGEIVTFAGLLTNVQHRTAKSGNLYGMVTIEDYTGEVQALFMGKSYQEFGQLLQPDSIVALRGKMNARDDGMTMHAYGVRPITAAVQDDATTLILTLSDTRATEELMEELKSMLTRHRGDSEVRLNLLTNESVRVFELKQQVRVTSDLYGELKGLLGPRCLNSPEEAFA